LQVYEAFSVAQSLAVEQFCMHTPPLLEMQLQPVGQPALLVHARVQRPPGKSPPVWQRPVSH
jgi:hypothetical protein